MAAALALAIPLAPVAVADPVLVVIAEHKAAIADTDDAVRHLLRHRAGRSRPIALAILGTPLTSTEGVVALFAYACDTLSRPEGIIDHTVDDRPRDLERWDNESAERAAAGTKSGTA